ncbi:hypothetical protein [Hyphomicrobium sp. ghe19]|uniref:hypothetical protein n=1 Tax=Hyphomicrobium sp. ghe19 TaxID=2682968 RepID=UPI001366D68E|nr:hypothetical protein HYPP_01534 [Hyphomicrobium sp. ghe19]
MREPEEMGWYAELGEDGEPRAVHGIKHLMPEGSVEITEAQAREISAQVRAREVKEIKQLATGPIPEHEPVDLQPVLDDIARVKEQILEHADLHDKHEKTFVEIKRNTAAAIAQVTEGIGDKQG